MQRRVESQFRRDWNFGYSIWNYLFRTAVNLQKNVYMYSIPDESNPERRRPMTGKEVLKGASDLLRALDSKYADVSGELKAVKGDLAKTRYCVPSLSREAVKVLDNLEARTRRIPGTQEVRTTMRLQTHANRVCYGLSVFLTFSPSECDTALMLRLARVRQSDPSLQSDRDRSFQSRSSPKLDEEFCRLSPEALLEELPDCDERKTLLARDPLACAEGFRVLVLLALRHLLGVRFCPRCPDCAASDSPCADAFGSNATATGGVLGRVDAVYGSIECQKAGSLHGHFQVFAQCFHQHTPLSQLMKLEEEGGVRRLFQKYASYSAHMRPGSSSLGRGGEKMVKRGGPGGGLLMVACSGFYVHLKSVFPLIRF